MSPEDARAYLDYPHEIDAENGSNDELRSTHTLKEFQARYVLDELSPQYWRNPEFFVRKLHLTAADRAELEEFLR